MKHRVVEELDGVVTFVGAVWIVFGIDVLFAGALGEYGLIPRSFSGLTGIVSMPFLHSSFSHLLSNSVPLIVLLLLLAGSRTNSYVVVPLLVALSGILLWCFGRTANHIGASGLVYALISFLILSGLLEQRLNAILLSLFVGLTYGATLFSGVLPSQVNSNVSWDGHLTGAIAGALIAVGSVRLTPLEATS